MENATGDWKGMVRKFQDPRSKAFIGECSNRPLPRQIVPRGV